VIELSESPQATMWIQDWVKGDMPASKVRRYAAASVQEHGERSSETVRILSKIGGGGKHESKCERDLLRLQLSGEDTVPVPELYTFQTTQRSKKNTTVCIEKPHSIILPHDWLSALYKTPAVFERVITGTNAELSDFWEHERAWPDDQRLSEVEEANRAMTAPVCVHGDDAGVFLKEKLLVLHMHPFASRHDCAVQKLLLTVMTYSLAVPGITMKQIMGVIHWSLAACYFGVHPPADHQGDDFPAGSWRAVAAAERWLLAGGWRLVLLFLEGDWKWHAELFSLRNYAMTLMCHLCDASKKLGATVYTDCSHTAGWRSTYVTTREYLDRLGPARCSPLCKLPGWTLFKIVIDSMHCIDLGAALLLLGNMFADVCIQGYYGDGPINLRLERLHAAYIDWCDRYNIQSRLEKFTKDDRPYVYIYICVCIYIYE
jgi:hypothetical protein